MNLTFAEIIILILPLSLGWCVIWRSGHRSALDVANDLEQDAAAGISDDKKILKSTLRSYKFDDELAAAGFIDHSERRGIGLRLKLLPFFLSFTTTLMAILVGNPSIPTLFFIAISTTALGYIISRSWLRSLTADHHTRINFFLPVVMERIVMAVESGLDIIPAVKIAIGGEEEEKVEGVGNKLDPVSRLLKISHQLAQAGISFEKSLQEVAEQIDSRSLRHAFIHLALAQREGGELVMPLRELSDATQLYFQESVEEEIATMPAKATLPLMLAFAGLIVCFLTSPLLQVLGIMERSMPK